MLVCLSDRLQIFRRDIRFVASGFFRNALPQNFGLGLQVNHQVRRCDGRGQHFVIPFVNLQLLIFEVDVRENFVFLEEKIADDGTRLLFAINFHEPLVPLHQEVHLCAERGSGLLVVKLAEEWIVLAIENAPGMQTLGEYFRQRGFANADGSFDDKVARRLKFGFGHGAAL